MRHGLSPLHCQQGWQWHPLAESLRFCAITRSPKESHYHAHQIADNQTGKPESQYSYNDFGTIWKPYAVVHDAMEVVRMEDHVQTRPHSSVAYDTGK